MPTVQVLLSYPASTANDRVLSEVAALCAARGARLSVVLPVIDEAFPSGCCGIQGDRWQRLVDEDAHAALARAARVLTGLGAPPERVTLEVGPSIPEVVEHVATRWGCTVVAAAGKRRPWSGGLSRRLLAALRRRSGREVVELGRR